jgi:hypothetical protein
MSIFHRHDTGHTAKHAAKDAAEDLAATDYDAQSDLALPTPNHADPTTERFSPYAGMVTPVEDGPAYDVERDTAS